MKILIIEDSARNVTAAREQLASHDLTVVETANKALELLGAGYARTGKCDFDVVLTDLLMPSPSYGLSGEAKHEYAGEWYGVNPPKPALEIPVGVFFALMAAKNGAKRVGVLTDSGHHDHPASALLDAFCASRTSRDVLMVGDAKLIMSNAGFLEYPPRQRGDDLDNLPDPTKRWDLFLEAVLEA